MCNLDSLGADDYSAPCDGRYSVVYPDGFPASMVTYVLDTSTDRLGAVEMQFSLLRAYPWNRVQVQ